MNVIIRSILYFTIFYQPLYSQEKTAKMLNVGDVAPQFSLPYATRDSIASEDMNLSILVGSRNIVLAFYPADWSGGCTKEVCTFRNDVGALSELNVEILAISGDYVYSHHEWAKHHNLPFKLLSDHSHRVARMYNSYNEETGYNKRTVYVIDKKGRIAYIDLKYSTRDLESFSKLKDALSKLQ
jgi:peroxiredoxin